MYVCLPRACGVAKRRTAATREAAILKLSAMADGSSQRTKRRDRWSFDRSVVDLLCCCPVDESRPSIYNANSNGRFIFCDQDSK